MARSMSIRAPIGQTWAVNFELEPWEVPPGVDAKNVSVAIEFGPMVWQGEATMVSARSQSWHRANFGFTCLRAGAPDQLR